MAGSSRAKKQSKELSLTQIYILSDFDESLRPLAHTHTIDIWSIKQRGENENDKRAAKWKPKIINRNEKRNIDSLLYCLPQDSISYAERSINFSFLHWIWSVFFSLFETVGCRHTIGLLACFCLYFAPLLHCWVAVAYSHFTHCHRRWRCHFLLLSEFLQLYMQWYFVCSIDFDTLIRYACVCMCE